MNSLILAGLVLTACLGVCLSEYCIADQQHAEQTILTTSPGPERREHNKVFYDAKNQRKLMLISTFDGNKKTLVYKYLIRYDDGAGMLYVTEPRKAGKCSLFPLSHPFEKFCVPDESKLNETFYVGPISAGLKVNTFHIYMKDRSVLMAAKIHDTNELFPVSAKFFANDFGSTFLESWDLSNIEPYIKNPEEVFAIPEQCKTLKAEKMALDHDVKHHMKFF